MPRGITSDITFTQTLVVEYCCACGVPFAMTEEFQKKRRSDGEWWYCPAGHTQHYTKSDKDRLAEWKSYAESLEKEKRAAEAEATYLRDHNQQLSNDLLDQVKERKRMEKRIHAGVCPFCRRQFQNVKAHMDRKHSGKEAATTSIEEHKREKGA